jgi:hypothetical protein
MQILVAGHSFIRRLDCMMKREKLTYNTDIAKVTVKGIGGARIAGPKSLQPTILTLCNQTKFDLIFLELGSNDITKDRNLQLTVDVYVRQVAHLCESFNMHAVICLPIPRLERLFPGSVEMTADFNKLLTAKVQTETKMVIWEHKRLHRISGHFLDAHGVHYNRKGERKYFHSLRSAITMYSGRLIGGNFKQ